MAIIDVKNSFKEFIKPNSYIQPLVIYHHRQPTGYNILKQINLNHLFFFKYKVDLYPIDYKIINNNVTELITYNQRSYTIEFSIITLYEQPYSIEFSFQYTVLNFFNISHINELSKKFLYLCLPKLFQKNVSNDENMWENLFKKNYLSPFSKHTDPNNLNFSILRLLDCSIEDKKTISENLKEKNSKFLTSFSLSLFQNVNIAFNEFQKKDLNINIYSIKSLIIIKNIFLKIIKIDYNLILSENLFTSIYEINGRDVMCKFYLVDLTFNSVYLQNINNEIFTKFSPELVINSNTDSITICPYNIENFIDYKNIYIIAKQETFKSPIDLVFKIKISSKIKPQREENFEVSNAMKLQDEIQIYFSI